MKKQLLAAAVIAGLAGFGASGSAGDMAAASAEAQVGAVVREILICPVPLTAHPNAEQHNCTLVIWETRPVFPAMPFPTIAPFVHAL